MFRRHTLNLFCILFCLPLFAQDKAKIDSLQSVFNMHQTDTIGVETLTRLAEEYYNTDPAKAEAFCWKANEISQTLLYDNGLSASYGWLAFLFEQRGAIDSALVFYDKGIEVARRTGNKKEQGQILNNVAAIYKDQGKIKEALAQYQQSIALYKQINFMNGMPAPLNNMGLIYQNQGQMMLALEYYERSLAIEDSIGNTSGAAVSYMNIATVHRDLGQYEEALEYAHKALKIEIAENDKYNQAYSLNTIGNIYVEQNNLQKGLAELNKGLKLREEIEDKQGIAYSLRNIGFVYEKLDSVSLAKRFYQRSLNLFRELENTWGECTVLHKLGNIYLSTGKKDSAMFCGLRSLELARALGYPIDIRNAADLLQRVYRSQGKFEQAVQMYDLFKQMQDSVQNDETRKVAMKSKFQSEYTAKENRLKAEQEKRNALNDEKVKQEKLVRNFFIGGAVMLLLLVLLLLNRYYIKNSANLALEKKNTIISEEKDRSEKLLLNILPSEVAAELKENGVSKARSFQNVTVMFTDFKDFTKIGEQLSPEALVSEIDYCFSEFDRIISKYNIEKIKTIGDAYMCVSGLPASNENHATDIVNAALDIRDFMDNYRKEREARGEFPFQIRIGVNTGPVVAGIVGIKKFAYDIWGDTVNLASRMESNGEAGKVNISASTCLLVADRFECVYRGKIEAKNKGLTDMYFAERKTG